MAPREKNKKLVMIKSDDIMKKKKGFFKQRFPGFKKKATELSILCGNSVGFICYGPDDDLCVWPEPKENPQALTQIVARFNTQSHLKRKKNGCDINDFPNLEGLSVEEVTSHLSKINSQLVGIKHKKIETVIKKIKGSSDPKDAVPVSGEDRSRVSVSANNADQKSKPNLVSEDHLVKVSDQNTKLGFGGVIDELGHVVCGETLGVSSNDCVMGTEAGGEEAEHYPIPFTNNVGTVWGLDFSTPLATYCQTPIADYWGNIQGFETQTTSSMI